jgi:VanZ family protein
MGCECLKTSKTLQKPRVNLWSLLFFAAIAVLIGMIWSFSFETGLESYHRSRQASLFLQEFIGRFRIVRAALGAFGITGSLIGEHIRKIAHVTEFALLGICTQVFFISIRRLNGHNMVHGISLGLFIAVADETIQTTLDRGPLVMDVVIDLSGVLLGSLLVWAVLGILKLVRRRR